MSNNSSVRVPPNIKQNSEYSFCVKNCGNTQKARNRPAYSKNCALTSFGQEGKNNFAKCCPNKDRLKYGIKASGKLKKVHEVVTNCAEFIFHTDP